MYIVVLQGLVFRISSGKRTEVLPFAPAGVSGLNVCLIAYYKCKSHHKINLYTRNLSGVFTGLSFLLNFYGVTGTGGTAHSKKQLNDRISCDTILNYHSIIIFDERSS